MEKELEKEKTTCECEGCSGNCECDETTKTCDCEDCKCDECDCERDEHHDKEDHHDKDKKHKYKKEIEKLKEKIEELEKEKAIIEEKSLRDKAEMINFRRRKEDEVSRIIKYSNEDLIKQILPTIDNFERAIKLDDENLEDELSKFLSGFKMIYCNLVSVLEQFEIKPIDGKNKPFDPTYHEAVMTDHVEGVEPGQVLEVLQKGYILKDKVIRPAMVKVSE